MIHPWSVLLAHPYCDHAFALVVRRAGSFAHHPEITVRTAYDLKPWNRSISKVREEWSMATYVNHNLCDPHGCDSESAR